MLDIKQLQQYFKLKIPIKDGEWWNGKPREYSNLPKWDISTTQRFGQNLLDYSQFGLKGHNGIDFGYNFRTPVVAPCRMWISYVQHDPKGYGNNIFGETESIKLNGDNYKLEMVFGHLDEIVVEAYHWVNEGTIIGYGDSTGFSTGDHLHHGIRPLVKLTGKDWIQMFPDNGYKGYISPELFIPKVWWTIGELEKNKEEFMTNVKLVKDANSLSTGFFVPADSPEALISLGKNFGIDIPKKDKGVDWDNLKIEGKIILN